jgi:uncharacterized membrane protein
MRFCSVGLALMFIFGAFATSVPATLTDAPNAMQSPTNPTGVDVRVVSATVEYTDAVDESLYKMFSSNHPVAGFNRPAELFVIDAMVNSSATLTITVENIGTNPSGVIDINVRLLHNDYAYFEFANTTVQMASLAGSGSNTVEVDVTPTYSGNHTLSIAASSSISDDNPNNDVKTQSFTVGHTYFNCDSSSQWTLSSGWMFSQDVYTYMSQGQSCHAGNGQFSSYNNNQYAVMTTPIMDMSDALQNPSRTNGLSFFYTGSTAANDELTIYGKNILGGWVEVGSITGTVDAVFTDGANWQTFSVLNKGHTSPLIPLEDSLFHSNSQFKFEFTSDASGTDVGFFIDEIVFVYEQKVRPQDYKVSAQGVSTNGATPGEWGSITMQIENTGNISEVFIPTLVGLPEGWNAYYTRPSGTSFDPMDGLLTLPGNPAEFTIRIQPDPNASIGFQQMSVNITSQQYPSVYTVLPVQFLIKADRIPVIHPPPMRPSCPPSFTCTFEVGLSNQGGATDVFDLEMDMSSVPSDWSINLAWTQTSSVLIRPNETVQAMFTMTIPADESPDAVVEFDLTLQAQNDSSRSDTKVIGVSASMLSDASVSMNNPPQNGKIYAEAGSQIALKYTIWNNASRQDIFTMRVDVEDAGAWIVHQPTRPDAVLNSGTSTTFEVLVDIPITAQADDWGPSITPVIESKRSMMEIEGAAFEGLRVSASYDVALELISAPSRLTPGIANEVELRLVNNGNGETAIELELQNTPPSWTWWLSVGSDNTTSAIPLSVSYDLEHEQNVSLWILLPMTEAAGELHTLTIQAMHENDELDTDEEDNQIELVMSTASVRVPSLQLQQQSDSAMAGQTIMAEAVIRNDGNAVENRLSVVARLSSVPPLPGLIAFFSVEGSDQPLANEVSLMVPAAGQQRLQLEVLIPDDAPLNTRFVLEFEILGVVDDEDLPVEMLVQALVILNQQRGLDSSAGIMNIGNVPHGTSAAVQVNLSSISTMNEQVRVILTGEEGWQTSCNKMLVNQSGLLVDFSPGHVAQQTTELQCEVLRMSGPSRGTVTVTTSSFDETISSTHTVTIVFSDPPADEALSSTALLGGGLGGLVFLGAVILLLRGRASHEEDEEFTSHSQAGPPVSTLQAEKNVPELDETQPDTESVDVEGPTIQSASPPLPEGGLPPGWTQEQWQYYGQQYLDGTL